MTADSTRNSPEPLARLRDYELLSRLGQGGMGAVYLARHAHLDKQVAVKLLPREHLRNPEMVARFKREMKAVGKLHHPNIIQAFDGGEEKGIHFLVMEYAEGLDLNTLLANYGKLPISDACEIIRQAAVGLEHAHLHGLVHRDIKPANILLAWPSHRDSRESRDTSREPNLSSPPTLNSQPSTLDSAPVVKVLDLGLALLNTDKQSLAKGITNTGQIMGTLDYMAPEQTSDTHTVDVRADIYSLGCTLYALLAGRPPFYGDQYSNAYQKIVAHNQASPRPLHEIRKNIPPAVVAVLNKMLAKRPDDRYTTPIEVAAALEPFCHGSTLLATLVEAEARQAEDKARSDAATQALNSSALEGTATGAAGEAAYSLGADDELLALLRSNAIDETIVTKPPSKLPETQFQLNVAAAPTVKKVRQVREQDSRRLRLQVIAAATCALLGIVIAAVVFRIMTNYGTIELTLYHKDAQVTVDGDTIRLRPSDADDHYTIRVAPGQHKLQVEKDGYTTFARDLEIAKGEEKSVGVQLLRPGTNVASTLPRAEPSTPSVVPGAASNNSSNSTLPGSSRRSMTATDRGVAEWVLSVGGSLQIYDPKNPNPPQEYPVTELDQLPHEPFELLGVKLKENPRVVDADGVRDLTRFGSLNTLVVNGIPVTDDDVEYLSDRLANLTALFAAGSKITDAGLRILLRNPGFRSGGFNAMTDFGVEAVRGRENIGALQLDNSHISRIGVEAIATCPQLFELTLKNGPLINDACMPDIVKLSKLKRLVLSGTAITDGCVDDLAKLTNLKELVLPTTTITPAALARLRASLPACDVQLQ
jgi:serine/threonine protein kinase